MVHSTSRPAGVEAQARERREETVRRSQISQGRNETRTVTMRRNRETKFRGSFASVGTNVPAVSETGEGVTGVSQPVGETTLQRDDESFSFVACVSNMALLEANLLASPCLDAGSPNEVIVVKGCPAAANGLKLAFEWARREWIACVHQDVFLPRGRDQLVTDQLKEAERRFGPIGVAGVYGVGAAITTDEPGQPLGAERIGWVNDRGRVLRDGPELPARVATLDEIVLVIRRNSGLRFDPELGFYLYGADICLQAHEQGLAVVALAAPCHHNSCSIGLPEGFWPVPRFSPANAATGCRWPHRASSSIKEVKFTCWETPWIGQVRLLSQSSAFVERRRLPRTKVRRPG